jgi:hypothetical protein
MSASSIRREDAIMRVAAVHAMQKWECEEITTKTEVYLVKELNDLGQHGWELVCVIQHKDRKGEIAWSAFVKRPYVQQPTEPVRAKALEEGADSPGSTADSGASGQGLDL